MLTKLGPKGFSLISLLVGIAVSGFIIVLLSSTVRMGLKRWSGISKKSEIHKEVFHLVSQIHEMGRIASSCAILAPAVLQCTFLSSPDVPETISWEFTNGKVIQKNHYSGRDTQDVTSGILSFDVCDGAVMKSGACPIEPAEISRVHTTIYEQNSEGALSPAFVRFRIKASEASENGPAFFMQGSFFARNSQAPSTGFRYLWGQRY